MISFLVLSLIISRIYKIINYRLIIILYTYKDILFKSSNWFEGSEVERKFILRVRLKD